MTGFGVAILFCRKKLEMRALFVPYKPICTIYVAIKDSTVLGLFLSVPILPFIIKVITVSA